jgi:hypothetical protein
MTVTTDFRAVLAEVVRGHLGIRHLETVFLRFAGPFDRREGRMNSSRKL